MTDPDKMLEMAESMVEAAATLRQFALDYRKMQRTLDEIVANAREDDAVRRDWPRLGVLRVVV